MSSNRPPAPRCAGVWNNNRDIVSVEDDYEQVIGDQSGRMRRTRPVGGDAAREEDTDNSAPRGGLVWDLLPTFPARSLGL